MTRFSSMTTSPGSAGGKKTWIVQYPVGNMQRCITLGAVNALDPEKARKAADPRASAAGILVSRYLKFKEASVRDSTHSETKHYLKRGLTTSGQS